MEELPARDDLVAGPHQPLADVVLGSLATGKREGQKQGEKVGGQGGAIFVGTEGRIAIDRDWLISYPSRIVEQPLGAQDVHLYNSNDHSSNFLDCVRTRKRTICCAETAHRAMSVILVGGIAEQLKRPLKWNPEREHFVDDAEADRMLSVPQRPPWHI